MEQRLRLLLERALDAVRDHDFPKDHKYDILAKDIRAVLVSNSSSGEVAVLGSPVWASKVVSNAIDPDIAALRNRIALELLSAYNQGWSDCETTHASTKR